MTRFAVAHKTEPLCVSVNDAARLLGGPSRTIIYQAISKNVETRAGLPFLPTLKIGQLRFVMIEKYKEWLLGFEEKPDSD